MKKTLVYHLYISGQNECNNKIYNLHKICLKRAINLFDRVKFTIVVDDLTEKQTIELGYIWVMDILEETSGIETEIRVKQNNEYRDSQTFYDRIVKNNDDDDLIFFFHSKGSTNFNNEKTSNKSIFFWVSFIYFICLEDFNTVYEMLVNRDSTTYGPLFMMSERKTPVYSGTGFWINYKHHILLREKNIIKDIPLHNRFFAENYYGYFINNGVIMQCTNDFVYDLNESGSVLYNGSENDWIGIANASGKLDEFFVFLNEINKEVGFNL